MELTELSEAKMKVMKEIADSNVTLAGLKADVKKLKEEKEHFFELRQNQVEAKLWEFLNNSRDLVAETEANYTTVHNFYEVLKGYAEFLTIERDEMMKQIIDFKRKTVDFENKMTSQITDLSATRKLLELDRVRIEEDQKFIINKKEELRKEQIKLKNSQDELIKSVQAIKRK